MIDWIGDTAVRLLVGAVYPVKEFLFDGSSRYFWLYCLTGLLIAAYGYRKHGEAREFEAALKDKNVWASQSALNDYVIMVVSPMLRLTVLSWTVLNWKTVSAFTVSTLTSFGVAGTVTDGNAVALGALLTLVLFIADDFLRWYTHYLFHCIPELWEFHKVHHSAEVLNFATSERHHPFEVVTTAAMLAVVHGVINGLFIWSFGNKLTVATIAGANIFLFVFNICGGVLRHSPFWISFGPRVERWIISPAMHQIHHSDKEKHFDRNMGGSLAIWDRMFGTLHIPQGREVEAYGIGPETADFRALDVIYFRPFTAAYGHLQRRFGRPVAKPARAQSASA